MKKYLMLFAVVMSLLQVPAAQAAEEVVVAQFGKEKFLLYLPLYLAMENGYFSQRGIELKLVFAGNDDQVFAAVAGGSAQFGVGDPVFTAIAQEKGFRAKTVAMLITRLGISGYTKSKDIAEITSLDRLEGLRIGSLPKPSTTFTLLDEIRRTLQADNKKVEIVEAGIGAQLALLEAEQVDIAVDLEPAVSKLAAEGYRVVFNLDDFTEPQAITGLMATEETILARPELVQKMVEALQASLTTILSESAAAVEVTQKLFPDLSKEVAETAVRRLIERGVFPKSLVVPDSYWQRTLKTRLDAGQLKKKQETGVSVENRFAAAAAPG